RTSSTTSPRKTSRATSKAPARRSAQGAGAGRMPARGNCRASGAVIALQERSAAGRLERRPIRRGRMPSGRLARGPRSRTRFPPAQGEARRDDDRREDPLDELVEADPGRIRGLRQQARLGQAGDRVELEHLELTGALLEHEVDPGEARAAEQPVDLECDLARALTQI